MKEFSVFRAKIYNYLTDDDYIVKKEKDTRKCMIKSKTKFEDYKNFLENDEKTLR